RRSSAPYWEGAAGRVAAIPDSAAHSRHALEPSTPATATRGSIPPRPTPPTRPPQTTTRGGHADRDRGRHDHGAGPAFGDRVHRSALARSERSIGIAIQAASPLLNPACPSAVTTRVATDSPGRGRQSGRSLGRSWALSCHEGLPLLTPVLVA